MKPLKEWVCDKCGEVIEKDEDGFLEWDKTAELKRCHFKIVHSISSPYKNCCRKDRSGNELKEFCGVDGLTRLILMIDNNSACDSAEVVELIRRLQTPYYEEARRYWPQAKESGMSEGSNEEVLFLQSDLIDIVRKFSIDKS